MWFALHAACGVGRYVRSILEVDSANRPAATAPVRRRAGTERLFARSNELRPQIVGGSFAVFAVLFAPCAVATGSRGAEYGAVQGVLRCRRRDSNPRHADYDSACRNLQSPVETGASGPGEARWTQIWTHLSAGLHGVALLTTVAVGRDR